MIKLHPIPAFTDNYIWLFRRADSHRACVVDPGDAAPVMEYLERHQLELGGILITHHHADHTGGIQALRGRYNCPVYGPAQRIEGITVAVSAAQTLQPEPGVDLQVIAVPGHTLDHVSYFMAGTAATAPVLFCGDTLFAGGCGRLFEGQPAQMLDSLQRLAALPGSTRVCCAHEYTLGNLRFALVLEPDNRDLQARYARVTALREQGIPSLPGTLAEELATNPFLRCDQRGIQAAASRHGGIPCTTAHDTFSTIRTWKNHF